jgi:predicted DNA-binding transcriptional regulator AlpA
MALLDPMQVSSKLGMSRTALHQFRRRERSFPEPIRVSPKVLRWDETDIDRWINAKKEINLWRR